VFEGVVSKGLVNSVMSIRHRPPSKMLLSVSLKQLAAWTALVACMGGRGIEAAGQVDGGLAAKRSSLLSGSNGSRVIVVGFMGGFVHRDDPHHPEVGLVRELHEEYSTGAYFSLFENNKVDEAYKTIVRELDTGDSDRVPLNTARPCQILLFGHSWGASAVVRLARKLNRAEIPVALTVQVDSVAKPFSNDSIIPPNVSEAANFYQAHGLIHGRSRITAADPSRTRIIGNFRREYRTEPAACRNFSWYSRLFTKGHIEIECDPSLWSEVRVLLERYMPNEGMTPGELPALGSHEPSTTAEF
jgi:hypothetical protein